MIMMPKMLTVRRNLLTKAGEFLRTVSIILRQRFTIAFTSFGAQSGETDHMTIEIFP
jgi:hypothetical protein